MISSTEYVVQFERMVDSAIKSLLDPTATENVKIQRALGKLDILLGETALAANVLEGREKKDDSFIEDRLKDLESRVDDLEFGEKVPTPTPADLSKLMGVTKEDKEDD